MEVRTDSHRGSLQRQSGRARCSDYVALSQLQQEQGRGRGMLHLRTLTLLYKVKGCLSFSSKRKRCGDEQTLQQTYSRVNGSARCVQNFDDSLGFAIRMTYRISLRSSSLWEPRHPLLKVFYVTSYSLPNTHSICGWVLPSTISSRSRCLVESSHF